MRVVHIVTAFPRGEDDPITPWLGRLLLALVDRGVRVEVLAPAYRGGPGSPSHEWRGIRVHRFRYAPRPLETLTHDETVPDRLRRSPAYGLLLPSYLAAGCAAATRLGRERPAVAHVHWPMPHALPGAALRAASGGRTALVSSFYSVELRWVERRMRWLEPLLRWSIRTSDAVTAISTATARMVIARHARPVRVIPFAAAVAPRAREEAGGLALDDLEGGRPIELLFVGRLVERKGVEVLVRALPEVRRNRPARLSIVGSGEREERIREVARRAGVAEHVRFLGRVSEEELARAYASCDLFVLPAVVDRKGDTEGLGVVLLEALRFGRPVIASRLGGIPDIVVDGETGWLVPAGDPEALAAAILEAAGDPEEARRRAARGRERAERRFGLGRVTEDLIACYEGAARRRREGRPAEGEPGAEGGA